MAFDVKIDAADLDDLRQRISRTRWPEPELVDDWSQGAPLAYVRELAQTWLKDYDWQTVQAQLNAHGSSRTTVDGLPLHFLHVRSPRADARPLLITHGWPGSVIELLEVVEGLTTPPEDEPAFHVVGPSLPGFGFSGKPTGTGWGIARIADAWCTLMTRLGYDRFLAQGGDWGAMVTIMLAVRHADRVAMMHTTAPWSARPDDLDEATLSEAERKGLADFAEFSRSGRGYALQQATRPQTTGYGLTDSPAGQLAWIVDKFFAWSDSERFPEDSMPRQRILDNASLYWLTASAASSARLYWESFSGPGAIDMSTPVSVPSAVSVFPRDLMRLPRRWAERRFTDLRHWGVLDRGGHFPMLEVPDLFVQEMRLAFARAPH